MLFLAIRKSCIVKKPDVKIIIIKVKIGVTILDKNSKTMYQVYSKRKELNV